jgi:hypothetical protein
MKKYKYPRTLHLPWSNSVTSKDKILPTTKHFEGKQVVITEKMDGENTTLYRDYLHARSIDSKHHPSRDWIKQFHSVVSYKIPPGWRICGENLYAKHSIHYKVLKSYFQAFSVWDDTNTCLDYDSSLELLNALSIDYPKVLYRGLWNEALITSLSKAIDTRYAEGYVVRVAHSFKYKDFGISIAKWVRPSHVQTDNHWMHEKIVPNILVDGEGK